MYMNYLLLLNQPSFHHHSYPKRESLKFNLGLWQLRVTVAGDLHVLHSIYTSIEDRDASKDLQESISLLRFLFLLFKDKNFDLLFPDTTLLQARTLQFPKKKT